MSVYPVIMCGGAGTRLWPASRPSRPKQFIKLLGDTSPFQDTVRRVSALSNARPPVIVGAVAHQFWIEQQLAELGVDGVLILEPTPRDSAPAMAAALTWIADADPEGVGVVVASDHHIPDAGAFRSAIDTAVEAARAGWIVTLGVKPSGPATSYGYIRAGAPAGAAWRVEAFVEKPDAEAAQTYVEAGHLWNSGNFIVQARTFLGEMERHAPEVRSTVRRALDDAHREGPALHLGASFAQAPRISIDYALMEKTGHAAVLPVDFAWSDVGAWDAVHDVSPQDAEGNAAQGAVILEGSRDCLVQAEGGMVVAAIGVSGVAIIAERDAVLVCDLASSQQVKQVVDRLKAGRHAQVDVAAAGSLGLPELAAGYIRWLRCAALPLWWSLGADHEGGGFHEALDLEGRPIRAPRRARVQARQIYSYGSAVAQGWAGPWRQAAEHGLHWHRAHYRRADGLYRTLVAADGSTVNDEALLYDQAFTLLALSALYRAGVSAPSAREEADSLLQQVVRTFGDPSGGFREVSDQPLQANPQMHLFEAALAWIEARHAPAWREIADGLAERALTRFRHADSGAVGEVFRRDGVEGPGLEPGHQFKWAGLLERWSRLSGDGRAHAAARRLMEAGREGVDTVRGVVLDESPQARGGGQARLRPQAERLKAVLIMSEAADDPAVWRREAAQALQGLNRYLEPAGLWRNEMLEDGSFVVEPAAASSLHHLMAAGLAVERVLGGGAAA